MIGSSSSGRALYCSLLFLLYISVLVWSSGGYCTIAFSNADICLNIYFDSNIISYNATHQYRYEHATVAAIYKKLWKLLIDKDMKKKISKPWLK